MRPIATIFSFIFFSFALQLSGQVYVTSHEIDSLQHVRKEKTLTDHEKDSLLALSGLKVQATLHPDSATLADWKPHYVPISCVKMIEGHKTLLTDSVLINPIYICVLTQEGYVVTIDSTSTSSNKKQKTHKH